MEESWENWDLHTEMDCDDDDFADEFLGEILLWQQPPPAAFSSESESDHSFHASNSTVQTNSVAVAAADGGVEDMGQGNNHLVKSNSSNSIVSQNGRLSSPKTFILSFDNSTMTPAAAEPCLNSHSPPNLPSKRTPESPNPAEPKTKAHHGAKRARTSSQTTDHIMAERKRRQELTERFIALSATIPGLSKTDKASVLRAAIEYVKQLQERVQELEKQDKNGGVLSVIVIKKPGLCGTNNNEDNSTGETSSDYCSVLPEIDARVLGKEVLIEIHCEKEIGIELKILNHLENLQLGVNGSSVLPFGNSALSITIIAQMGDEYKMTVNDLVKSVRQVLLESQMDPY